MARAERVTPALLSQFSHDLLISLGEVDRTSPTSAVDVGEVDVFLDRRRIVCGRRSNRRCDDLELAGTALGPQQADSLEVTSLEDAVQGFEKNLLQQLFTAYPSTRQLAARLNTSHTAIGQRLRKYGISR